MLTKCVCGYTKTCSWVQYLYKLWCNLVSFAFVQYWNVGCVLLVYLASCGTLSYVGGAAETRRTSWYEQVGEEECEGSGTCNILTILTCSFLWGPVWLCSTNTSSVLSCLSTLPAGELIMSAGCCLVLQEHKLFTWTNRNILAPHK